MIFLNNFQILFHILIGLSDLKIYGHWKNVMFNFVKQLTEIFIHILIPVLFGSADRSNSLIGRPESDIFKYFSDNLF